MRANKQSSDTNTDGVIDDIHDFGLDGLADVLSEKLAQEGSIDDGRDTDGDGVPDFLDLDSDNDGLSDALESSPLEFSLSFDGAGDITSQLAANLFSDSPSVDENGLISQGVGIPTDTDGDAIADYRDLDSDNDGVLDVVESFGATMDLDGNGQRDEFIDLDGDGLSDNLDRTNFLVMDIDEDGLINAIDVDSDGDGLSDLLENGGQDIDNDGRVDNLRDANADGIDDAIALLPVLITDTDGDGMPDYMDIDSDNDGVSDLIESGGVDINGDGQADSLTQIAGLTDQDGDSVPDHLQSEQALISAAQPVGAFRVGLGGSGCSIHYGSKTGFDPTLPAMGAMALLWLVWRRRGTAGPNIVDPKAQS